MVCLPRDRSLLFITYGNVPAGKSTDNMYNIMLILRLSTGMHIKIKNKTTLNRIYNPYYTETTHLAIIVVCGIIIKINKWTKCRKMAKNKFSYMSIVLKCN